MRAYGWCRYLGYSRSGRGSDKKKACNSINGIEITYSIIVRRRRCPIVADVLGHTCIRGIVARSSENHLDQRELIWWRMGKYNDEVMHEFIASRLLSLRSNHFHFPITPAKEESSHPKWKLFNFILFSAKSFTMTQVRCSIWSRIRHTYAYAIYSHLNAGNKSSKIGRHEEGRMQTLIDLRNSFEMVIGDYSS